MKPSLRGRADLIRALAHNNPTLTTAMADLLGYQETPGVASQERRSTSPPSSSSEADTRVAADTPYAPANVPFWRLEAYEAVAAEDRPLEPSPPASAELTWRHRPASAPGFTPLAPRRVVLTRLRQVAGTRRATPEIDVDAVVERLSQGRFLDDMPRRQRRAWGTTIHIIEDRARRLVPYWRDQDDVTSVLRDLYPPSGVTVARLDDGASHPVVRWPQEQRGQTVAPLPGALVLVLGDLGCLASRGDHVQRFWLQWGRHLRAHHHRAIALVPAPARDIPTALARTWTVVRWDATAAVLADIAPPAATPPVQRLLTLLSPAVRLEPGLLRAVRCLVPEGRHDPGLEARLWQDAAVTSQHSIAATLEPEQRKDYLRRFAEEPEALRKLVLEQVRAWRGDVHAAVWFEEILGLDPQSRDHLVDAADREDAETFFVAFADMLHQVGPPSIDTAAWILRLAERLPLETWTHPRVTRAIHLLYDLVRPRDVETQVPAGYDPAVVSPVGQPVRQIALWQAADQLLLRIVTPTSSTVSTAPVIRGSPLGMVHTASGEIKITPSQPDQSTHAFWQEGRPPAWAQAWGWDAFGAWVTLRLGEVEQRLRWIEPGCFRMGSLGKEVGRFDDEGPRHEVTLTRGFWLFDTPCTQALWQAVMRENPSEFKGMNRPVEQVSWDDCQRFLEELNARLPDLALRLPAEAQWEYACRAGTVTARYEADIDAIVWYGANSNHETHEVGRKLPNAWGLYDMLGNVDEWCHDGMRVYSRASVTDPMGSTEAGADRVIRGGSWLSGALYVRAASRLAYHPGYRVDYLGFRCSSSGGSEPARARATWRASEQKAEPAETAPRKPAAWLVNVYRQPDSAIEMSVDENFAVNTDCERLYVGRITCPSWASEIGRDEYGLWATFEIDGIRQRLRWIAPGRFWMGSPDEEEGRLPLNREGPRHEVILTRGFWLFDTPCTQALWQVVMEENLSRFKGANRPVEQVSWEECQRFLEACNARLPGLALRLPTEAQWEYACRGGTETARYEADIDAIAWYDKNSNSATHEVGRKRPNAWGLYDMLGNVYEWCHDGMRTYSSASVGNPVGSTEAGAVRVFRGGSWYFDALFVRAAYRYADRPGDRGGDLGFRCSSSG